MPERQVDHVDGECFLVRDDEIDRLNHIARVAAAVPVQHFQHENLRSRRDAGVKALRVGAAAGNEPGDMRAVAVVVVRRNRDHLIATSEVVETQNPTRWQVGRNLEP